MNLETRGPSDEQWAMMAEHGVTPENSQFIVDLSKKVFDDVNGTLKQAVDLAGMVAENPTLLIAAQETLACAAIAAAIMPLVVLFMTDAELNAADDAGGVSREKKTLALLYAIRRLFYLKDKDGVHQDGGALFDAAEADLAMLKAAGRY